MNQEQTDITTGKQKFCSITKIKAYGIAVNEVALRANDVMLRINDVVLRTNGHAFGVIGRLVP